MPRAIVEEYDSLTRRVGGHPTHSLPTHWPFNDFGHAVWYMVNAKTGVESEQFLHETPENERQEELKLPVVLEYSHGCVHVRLADVDEMMKKHFLVNGTRFVIHRYNEVAPSLSTVRNGHHHHKYVLHFSLGASRS
jgi:hypothetical protein